MRRTTSLCLLALTAVIAGTIWLWGQSGDRRAEHQADLVHALETPPNESVVTSLPSPVAPSHPERIKSRAATVSELPAASPVPEGPGLTELVAQLVVMWDERADVFHAEAPALLLAFEASMAHTREELASELVSQLDRHDLAEPVRGALVALLGSAISSELTPAGVFALAGPGLEEQRGARLGLVAAWSGEPDTASLFVDPREDEDIGSAYQPHGRSFLQLPLNRTAGDDLYAILIGDLYRVAENLEQLVDRWLAVVALGPAVETSGPTVDLFAELLFDDSQLGAQVHVPILFVLSRSEQPRLLDLVRRYTRESKQGSLAIDMARLWLGSQGGDEELDALMESLAQRRPPTEAMFALGSIHEWVSAVKSSEAGLSQAEDQRIADLAAKSLDDYDDRGVRTVALSLLSFSTTEGYRRLEALQGLLESDETEARRQMAVRGLARTSESLIAEAEAMLRARLLVEEDPGVIQAIHKELGL